MAENEIEKAAPREPTRPSGTLQALEEIRGVLTGAAILVLVLVVWGPQLQDKAAQTILGVLTALVTTLISVYATYHSARHSARSELQRYGLLAWRHLDALQLKIRQLLVNSERAVPAVTLEAWDLDVDQAKWAWQDLLREVFEIEKRLQAETDEVAREYKRKIHQATNPEERSKLQAEQQLRLARLEAAARLPLRVPTEVKCPNCAAPVAVAIGPSAGETSTTKCPSCRLVFHAHRGGDGSIFVRKYGGPSTTTGPRVLQFVRPESHLTEIQLVAAIFSAAPGNRVQDWSDFKTQLQAALAAKGLDREADGRIHQLLFRLKAFRLYGVGNGIGLAVEPARLVDFIEERIAVATALRDARALNVVLYDGNEDRLAALQAVVEKVAPAAAPTQATKED